MTGSGQTAFPDADLIVVGGGPAGCALAHRAAVRGWSVIVVDPGSPWTSTFGMFTDELPGWLDESVFATVVRPLVIGDGWRCLLPRDYGIIDNHRLFRTLDGFRRIPAVANITGPTTVTIDGATWSAPIVVDARGAQRSPGCARQVARGVFTDPVDAGGTGGLAENLDAVWMDLRQTGAGPPRIPTFCYTVPVGKKILVEETVLATRGALEPDDLNRALEQRIKRKLLPHDDTEDVVIPVDGRVRSKATACFGARAGLVSPVTGYSVAASLRTADGLVDALAPVLDNRCAGVPPWAVLPWRIDRWLVDRSLNVVCALETDELGTFLAPVFALDAEAQRRFFSLGDAMGTFRGMAAVFLRAPTRLKAKILREFLAGSPSRSSRR